MVFSLPMILKNSASFSQSIRNRLRLKNLQAQAKNFCRVLDIRVPQIVEADVFQPGIPQDLLMELYHRIGVVHSTGHRRGGATRPPPGAEEGRGASGSGRRLSSPLRRAKKTPGTATGNR